MFIVQIDAQGYFTGSYARVGSISNGIEIDNLPEDLTNYKTTCYQYGDIETEQEVENENGSVEVVKVIEKGWMFDSAKHESILAEIEEIKAQPTQEEVINNLLDKNKELEEKIENLITQFTSMMK